MMGLSKWLAVVVLLTPLLVGIQVEALRGGRPKSIPRGKPKQVFGFRTVPWCINGEEPEFRKYPLSEFKRFVDRNDQYLKSSNGGKYEINLLKIQVEDERIGESDFLLNHAHFQFKAMRRREYNKSVLTDYEETFLEGLIVQPIFAPMGVGLPTGNFIDPEEFNCHDCEYPIGQVVGCKKRTWLNFMHPTIMVFHHKMKTPHKLRKIGEEFCEFRKTQRYCHVCDEKGQNCKLKVTEEEVVTTTTTACSVPAGCPTQAPLGPKQTTEKCVKDDDCAIQPVNGTAGNGTIGKCMGLEVEYKCFNDDDLVLDDKGNDKDCLNRDAKNKTILPPTGVTKKCKQDQDPPEECKRYLKPEEIRHTTCSPLGAFYGRTSEVHGNFKWYTPPCHYTRRIRFLFLAVHSFQKGIYSVLQSGEFLLPQITKEEHPNHNSFIPSPLFTGFRHFCEPKTPKNYNDDFVGEDSALWTKEMKGEIPEFDFSRSYDESIRNRSVGVWPPDCLVNGNHTCPPVETKKKKLGKAFEPPPRCLGPESVTKDHDQFNMDMGTESVVPRCNTTCPTLPSTQTYPTTTITPPLIKRTAHGAINFVANFCIMPICIFIARFYKETCNTSTLKGAKGWYWMHMVGAGGSSIIMYFGYFSRKYVTETLHVKVGYAYMACLLVSYMTAWMRNTKAVYTMVMETIHGITGYACFALAFVCMHTVNIGLEPKLFAYAIAASLFIFYIAMEAFICIMDNKFGMEPSRRHFPTVEARFDDVPVPGAWGRMVILVLYTLTILTLSMGTVYFE